MDELHGQDLKLAYWYNTHRAEIRTAAYGTAIAAVSILWLIVIVLFIRWSLRQGATNQAINQLADTQVIYDSIRAPQALIVTASAAVTHTSSTIDIYALITNPNRYHVGRFQYTVTVNGVAYDYNDGIIMPAADSAIVVPNLTGAVTNSVAVTIGEVTWQRIRGPQPVAEFLTKDLALVTSEIPLPDTTTEATDEATEFATPDDAETDSAPPGEPISQVAGTLTNASAYGFRRVKATAVITSVGGNIIGAQQVVLSNVASFSDTALRFNWQRRFEFNSQPSVLVETDLWDSGNLIKPGDQ